MLKARRASAHNAPNELQRALSELPLRFPFGCDFQPRYQCTDARQPNLYVAGL